ncbi:MAG: hypothetical protein JW818_22950 [Pirellulales bacterium]|nr:hypothetical protein [Pirellulales bacterium]
MNTQVKRKNQPDGFGSTRIYYNNFAGHLLGSYNPNMLHPGLPGRYSDEDWFRTIDMIGAFGFNVFEFWLVPRLFCREGLNSNVGREFARQMNATIEYAGEKGIRAYAVISLATVGSDWRTYCPNDSVQWRELQFLWDAWTKRLPGLGGVDIFPGDPGGCSLGGCTAETFIDKSVEIAAIVQRNLPDARLTFNTWGPPFFAWGVIQGPDEWNNEFLPGYQATAWESTPERTDRAMTHLLRRLPDFPDKTAVAINLGFNPDGIPEGNADARPWAREIAKTHPIQTWDFSLTEGENAVLPHCRLERLFQQRRRERDAAPYRGGICFTMSPKLNQLSSYAAAQSFLRPDADHRDIAAEFFENLFGPTGRRIVPFMPLFEVIEDWGNFTQIGLARDEYHGQMEELAAMLEGLTACGADDVSFFPSPDEYRRELVFFARLFADLTGRSPDYNSLRRRYWNRVYAIYDHLPTHVDPRPREATDHLIQFFQKWDRG